MLNDLIELKKKRDFQKANAWYEKAQDSLSKKLFKQLKTLTVKAAKHAIATKDMDCQYFELEHSNKRHK